MSNRRHFLSQSAAAASALAFPLVGGAQAKALGEERVRAAFPTATILRPSIVFGPEDNFFNRFGAMARMTPWFQARG